MAFQALPSLVFRRRRKSPLISSRSTRQVWRACADANESRSRRDFLQPVPGPTGTLCANLFPLPVLGAYGWILNVWKHNHFKDDVVAIKVSQSCLSISLGWEAGEADVDSATALAGRTLNGTVTGNYNVASALEKLGAYSSATLAVSNNQKRLSTKISALSCPPAELSFWSCQSLICSPSSVSPDLVVADVFVGEDTPPKSKFEYFIVKGYANVTLTFRAGLAEQAAYPHSTAWVHIH